MSLDKIIHTLSRELQMKYRVFLPEIRVIQKERQEYRDFYKAKVREHGALTGPMHEVEREILGVLVPDLNSRDGIAKEKAMRWILKQPWGEDFSPAPVEKKWKGHDIISVAG